MQTFIEEPDDMQWITDVHKVNTSGYVCAILYGNEDCPDKIELFKVNDYRCKPDTYTYCQTKETYIKES